MNFLTSKDQSELIDDHDDNGQNTMAVLSTLGGGEDALPEGEPLGLDPDAGKAKISGSSLAVGVVVVLAVCALLGMKMTLKAVASDDSVADAVSAIDTFIKQTESANNVGAQGPIKQPDEESNEVFRQLREDPTEFQVPVEEVEKNPFTLAGLIEKPDAGGATNTRPTDRDVAFNRAQAVAQKFKVDSISGNIAFIDGEMYRVGEAIGSSGFLLESIDGLTCVVRTTDAWKFGFRIRYK